MKTVLNTHKWVDNYGNYLFSLAKYKIGDEDLAKDLVQDTFFSGIKSMATFRGDCSEKTWLVKILNNKIIDHYRKNRVEISMTEYLADTHQSFNEHYFDLNPSEHGHAKETAFPLISGLFSDSRVKETELKKMLDYCKAKLPPSLSAVFFMKYIDGCKAEFICKEFNISSANYWVILHRAKLILRTCISKNWFTED